MTEIAGNYFFPRSARFIAATAAVDAERALTVRNVDSGETLAKFPLRKIRVSARLGTLMRRFDFPDGARFETRDNDGADEILRAAGRLRRGGVIDRIERSFKWVAIAFVTAILAIYLFVSYGIPDAALWLADETPGSINATISDQTLNAMDRFALKPTALKPANQGRAQMLFARISAQGGSPGSYRLLFRNGGRLGPNAFSLPDGRVILTDQLYARTKSDDELEGVFGHEIAHVDRRHGLQRVYQASLVPAAIALMSGDVTQVGHMAAILPGVLIQAAYSRGMEQQADDDAAVMMKRIGGNPAALGNLLERVDAEFCRKSGCLPSWLGDHPATIERAAKLRSEGAGSHS